MTFGNGGGGDKYDRTLVKMTEESGKPLSSYHAVINLMEKKTRQKCSVEYHLQQVIQPRFRKFFNINLQWREGGGGGGSSHNMTVTAPT